MRQGALAQPLGSRIGARVFQVVISVNTTAPTSQREPAAVRDLDDVGAEERQVDHRKSAVSSASLRQRSTPSARAPRSRRASW